MRAWERKTAGNSTEREARPYCDRGGERENQRKEGDGWMGWFGTPVLFKLLTRYTLHVRCNPSKYSIPFPCGLRARVCSIGTEAFFEVRKEWESEKGADHSRPCITWISQKASRPALFPPQCQIRTRIRVADASAAVVSFRVWGGVPGLLAKGGGAKGSLLCIHTKQHIHIH